MDWLWFPFSLALLSVEWPLDLADCLCLILSSTRLSRLDLLPLFSFAALISRLLPFSVALLLLFASSVFEFRILDDNRVEVTLSVLQSMDVLFSAPVVEDRVTVFWLATFVVEDGLVAVSLISFWLVTLTFDILTAFCSLFTLSLFSVTEPLGALSLEILVPSPGSFGVDVLFLWPLSSVALVWSRSWMSFSEGSATWMISRMLRSFCPCSSCSLAFWAASSSSK